MKLLGSAARFRGPSGRESASYSVPERLRAALAAARSVTEAIAREVQNSCSHSELIHRARVAAVSQALAPACRTYGIDVAAPSRFNPVPCCAQTVRRVAPPNKRRRSRWRPDTLVGREEGSPMKPQGWRRPRSRYSSLMSGSALGWDLSRTGGVRAATTGFAADTFSSWRRSADAGYEQLSPRGANQSQ